MRFSNTIQFNSRQEWNEHYIEYSQLKKLIYQIEKQIYGVESLIEIRIQSNGIREPLNINNCTKIFIDKLDMEKNKVQKFYKNKEVDLIKELNWVLNNWWSTSKLFNSNRLSQFRKSLLHYFGHQATDMNDEDLPLLLKDRIGITELQDEDFIIQKKNNRMSLVELGLQELEQESTELYISIKELENFLTINFEGFRKILKKYDKITTSTLSPSYLEGLKSESPFLPKHKELLKDMLFRVKAFYAAALGIDLEQAAQKLESNLKSQLIWERNTVWKDMLDLERKSNSVKPAIIVSTSQHNLASSNQQKSYLKPTLTCLFILILFTFVLIMKPIDDPIANNCLALLTLVILLWTTEIIPLFTTAIIIPMLVVLLNVLKDPNPHSLPRTTLPPQEAANEIIGCMFSPTILLLLGGFTLASALSKHHIAKIVATYVLSKAKDPQKIIFFNMLVATFLSAFITNVAAPVLCFSIIAPLLRTIPQANKQYPKALILSIALASNIGGISSPISSPQNVIAMELMKPHPTWIIWFLITFPIAIVGNYLVWRLIIWTYELHPDSPGLLIGNNLLRYKKEPLNMEQKLVILITILTIVLWCFASFLESWFGSMGILALFPIFAFFSLRLLNNHDFNGFLWTVAFLAMGGIALGHAVERSGLLTIIVIEIQKSIIGLNNYTIIFIFSLILLFISTFISHTVSALIILPIVATISTQLKMGNIFLMSAVLMCSSAMGLPISGFPNINAIMMEDETGIPYLELMDFVKVGIPASFIMFFVVMSLGYLVMLLLLGF